MKISWGQFTVLILLGRIFTLMTYVPLMGEGFSALTQMTAFAVSTALQAVMVIPLMRLSKKYPGEDFFTIIRKKSAPICIITSIIYYLFAIFTCVKAVSHFSRFTATVFFPTVNQVLLTACFLIICAYGAWLGVEAIARTASAVFIFFVLMAAAIGFSAAGEMEFFRFYPEKIQSFETLLAAVLDDFGRNGEILLAVFLLPNIQGGLRKGFFSGLAGKLIILEVISFCVITVLGGYARLVEFPLFSLGSYAGTSVTWRFDAAYLVVWTMTAAVHIGIFLAAAGKVLREQLAVSRGAELLTGTAVFLGSLAVFFAGKGFLRFAEQATGAVPLAVLFFAIPLILSIGGNSHGKMAENRTHSGGGGNSLRNADRL